MAKLRDALIALWVLTITFAVFFLASLPAHAEQASEEATKAFVEGGYTAIVASIAIKFQSLGIESRRSYEMARKCVGDPVSVYQEAQRYLTPESLLNDVNVTMTLVAHDRCGLLKETRS